MLRPYSLGPDPYAAGQHRGVDVAGKDGEAVRAPASGTVSFAGVVPGSGRTVTIQVDGYAVSLTHLGEISVAKGAPCRGRDHRRGGPEWRVRVADAYVHLGIRVSSAADGYVDPPTLLPPRSVLPASSRPAGPCALAVPAIGAVPDVPGARVEPSTPGPVAQEPGASRFGALEVGTAKP